MITDTSKAAELVEWAYKAAREQSQTEEIAQQSGLFVMAGMIQALVSENEGALAIIATERGEVMRLRKENERMRAQADAIADVLDKAITEHDTANYEWGEENPWTMGEWFEDSDRLALAAYREGRKDD